MDKDRSENPVAEAGLPRLLGNNTLAAGTLKVQINSEGGPPCRCKSGDMQPGEWKPIGQVYELGMYNTGLSTLPCKYKISFTGVVNGSPALTDVRTVRVRHTAAGTPNPAGWPIVYDGPFNNFLIQSTLTPGIVGDGILGANITHVYVFEFKINDFAGNEYQGASATFNLQMDGYQVNDPIF